MQGSGMRVVRRALLVAVLGLGAPWMAACQSGGDAPAPHNAPAPKKKVVSDPAAEAAARLAAEVQSTLAPGVPMDTSTAPVDVHFRLEAVPKPGEPFVLEAVILPGAATPLLRLEVSGSEGLQILDPLSAVVQEKVQAGVLIRLRVRASAAVGGTHVVELRTRLELPSGAESRVYAVPVVVGPVDPAPPAPGPAARGVGAPAH